MRTDRHEGNKPCAVPAREHYCQLPHLRPPVTRVPPHAHEGELLEDDEEGLDTDTNRIPASMHSLLPAEKRIVLSLTFGEKLIPEPSQNGETMWPRAHLARH